MNYRVIDKENYYRKGVLRHFSEDCKCSVSMTARIDVTDLVSVSRATGSRFHLNFLYLLAKALNARDDYKMGYLWQSDTLICYDKISPKHYVFREETETCTPVYTEFDEDYTAFYAAAERDIEDAKRESDYREDAAGHPNFFDASYIPWVSYDALHIELPDGYLYFAPIVNWGRYREENGRLMMPVTVRMNHAVADGEKRKQEIASLTRVSDSFKKIVVVKDAIIPWHDENGILYIGVEQFLLDENAMSI